MCTKGKHIDVSLLPVNSSASEDMKESTKVSEPTMASAESDASPSRRAHRRNKRRAARACLGCRKRKVRCDVIECLPCRNCKWDGIECVVQHGRRKPGSKKLDSSGAVIEEPEELTYTVVSTTKTPRRLGTAYTPSEPTLASTCWTDEAEAQILTPTTTSPSTVGDDDMFYMLTTDDEPFGETISHDHQRQNHSLGRLLSSMATVIRKSSWDAAMDPTPDALQAHQRVCQRLPGFIKPPSKDLESTTLEFLQSNGAFNLPSTGAQRALLRAYVRGVHYNMPCVDVHHLARAQISSSVEKGSVSLLLYQAVMFAGALYADQKVLEGIGYSSRPVALRELFRRAKLLYNLEFEKESLSVVQALLLFSLRSPASSKQQNPSSWTQLAISIIRQDHLHCETASAKLPRREASMWKRLWWCCVIRDAFNALGECHAPSIRDDECENSVLRLEDFDITPIPEGSSPGISMRSIEEQTRLAELFIELGGLSLRLSRVLWAQSHPSGSATPSQADELIISLGRWHRALPPSCQSQSPSIMFWNNGASLVDVHRSFLHMTYHATILTLHRQCILSPSASGAQKPGTSLAAQSANSILQLAAGLVTCGLDDLLPVTGVALLLPALIVHSLDAATYSTNYKTAQDAQQSMQILERMSERFAFADMAACYLEPLRQVAHASADTRDRNQAEAENHIHSAQSPERVNGPAAIPNSTSPRTVERLEIETESLPAELDPFSPLASLGAALDKRGLGALDSNSPDSVSFDQLMGDPLTNTPDFTTWGYMSPIIPDTKDQTMTGAASVTVVDHACADGRVEGIFQHIEDEIVQILACS